MVVKIREFRFIYLWIGEINNYSSCPTFKRRTGSKGIPPHLDQLTIDLEAFDKEATGCWNMSPTSAKECMGAVLLHDI
jgi:hypothetical protein